jgi:hypothetical protein
MFYSKETTKLLLRIKIARLELLIYRFFRFVSPSIANKYKKNLKKRLDKLDSEVFKNL